MPPGPPVRLPCVRGPLDGREYVRLPTGVPLVGRLDTMIGPATIVHVYEARWYAHEGIVWEYVGDRMVRPTEACYSFWPYMEPAPPGLPVGPFHDTE